MLARMGLCPVQWHANGVDMYLLTDTLSESCCSVQTIISYLTVDIFILIHSLAVSDQQDMNDNVLYIIQVRQHAPPCNTHTHTHIYIYIYIYRYSAELYYFVFMLLVNWAFWLFTYSFFTYILLHLYVCTWHSPSVRNRWWWLIDWLIDWL